MSGTALQVQQNALTALLADPERLNALPIDKLERMLDMHERMLAAQAKTDFNAAFQRVQDQVDPVPKRGRIDRRDGTSPTPYQLVTDVVDMLRPLLKENQLTYSVSNTESPVEGEVDVRISKNVYKKMPMVRFTLRLRHIAGHEEFHHLDVPAGSGTGGTMNTMQAMASTASYCERHLLCKAFGVITGPDNDGADVKGQEPITEEQVAYIEALSKEAEVGTGFAEFMRDMFRVEGIAQIAKADYLKAARAIKSRMKTKGIPVPPHLEEPWARETRRKAQ